MEWCREMKEQKLEEVCSKYITQLTESIEAQRKYKKNPPIIMLNESRCNKGQDFMK